MNILQQLGAFIGDKISLLYDAIDNHKKDFANPHKVTKSQVGLGNVDNTSDMNKPVSTLQSTAIGVINQSVSNHITNGAIHKTSEQIRSEIVDIDIPKTIVRDVDMGKAINSAIGIHDQDVLNHQDIRNEINNIKTGATPVTKSEYAEKLGIEGSFYTKQTLDTKINKHIKIVAYDPTRAIFTFTFEDGTTTVIDTPIENTVKDGRYDNLTNELVLVLVSGQEIRIPAAGLIKVYSGADTPTSSTSVSTDGKISVALKQGCIDTVHLSAALLESINSHQTKTGDTKDNVTTFIEASVPDNIISGEKHSVMFGKIKKWFTRLRSMAFKDSINLSCEYAADFTTVKNDCGDNAIIGASTNLHSGVMTAADRNKLDQLFNGTMIDGSNPAGCHIHNYLEMSDLPPTVELSASTYKEFKDSLLKLKPEVTKGKFGRIILTGSIVIDDDVVHDITNIEIVKGGIDVYDHPFRIIIGGASRIRNVSFFRNIRPSKDTTNIIVNGISRATLDIENCRFIQKSSSDQTPDIILNNGVMLNMVSCGNNYASDDYPSRSYGLYIKCDNSNRQVYHNIANYKPAIRGNFTQDQIKKSSTIKIENINYHSNNSTTTDSSCILNCVNVTSELYSSGVIDFKMQKKGLGALITAPEDAQRSQYFVFCGDGIWRDIRTLTI